MSSDREFQGTRCLIGNSEPLSATSTSPLHVSAKKQQKQGLYSQFKLNLTNKSHIASASSLVKQAHHSDHQNTHSNLENSNGEELTSGYKGIADAPGLPPLSLPSHRSTTSRGRNHSHRRSKHRAHNHDHNHSMNREDSTQGYYHQFANDSNVVVDEGGMPLQDSFGNIPYKRVFRKNLYDNFHPTLAHHDGDGGGADAKLPSVPPTTSVPWELRASEESQVCGNFAFLGTRHFWMLIQFAMRVTFIAMLVPAVIINAELSNTPFISATFALTAVISATGIHVGESCVFFVQFIKAGFTWLPLTTACAALKLNEYLAAWFVVFTILIFFMATFTVQITRRICLMSTSIAMVSLLSGNQSLTFPSRVLLDWFIGAAFALAAVLLPYPLLATRISIKITETLFKNTATCFTGILDCFWAPSNTERSMSMVRIRHLVRTLDNLIDQFDEYDAFTFYELLLFETYERRQVRKEEVKLLVKLKMNLRSMERVINMLQERPQMLDQSERCLLFRQYLHEPIQEVSRAMETILFNISNAESYSQLKALGPFFEMTGRSIKELQNEFEVARKILFYENVQALECDRLEEYVPLMTFFVFSIVNFWKTLDEFDTFIQKYEDSKDCVRTVKVILWSVLNPFVENAQFVKRLVLEHKEADVRVVIEAAKVSVAMLISVIFFYYIDNRALLLSGPTIIAFVSGSNPVEAVRASAARLSGTLIGSVVGSFAASLCRGPVDRVIALCAITFVMTLFRHGYSFSTICMYCNFVAVSSLGPEHQTADDTISRIQQNTFAIFIYCFISVTVFPVSPNRLLLSKRVTVVKGLTHVLWKLMGMMDEAASGHISMGKKQDDLAGVDSGQTSLFVPPTLLGAGGFAMMGADMTQTLPTAFTRAPQDKAINHVFDEIGKLFDIMKETTHVLPLAAEEFYIIPREYPLRASGDIHAALYRLCALVYTMACSWKLMRDKGYFTPEMVHVFHSLLPISMDIMQCMDTFSSLLVFYVRAPASGLSSELTKCAMQLRALCVELSFRKEKAMLATIRKTIEEKVVSERSYSVQTSDGRGTGGGGGGDYEGGGTAGVHHLHSTKTGKGDVGISVLGRVEPNNSFDTMEGPNDAHADVNRMPAYAQNLDNPASPPSRRRDGAPRVAAASDEGDRRPSLRSASLGLTNETRIFDPAAVVLLKDLECKRQEQQQEEKDAIQGAQAKDADGKGAVFSPLSASLLPHPPPGAIAAAQQRLPFGETDAAGERESGMRQALSTPEVHHFVKRPHSGMMRRPLSTASVGSSIMSPTTAQQQPFMRISLSDNALAGMPALPRSLSAQDIRAEQLRSKMLRTHQMQRRHGGSSNALNTLRRAGTFHEGSGSRRLLQHRSPRGGSQHAYQHSHNLDEHVPERGNIAAPYGVFPHEDMGSPASALMQQPPLFVDPTFGEHLDDVCHSPLSSASSITSIDEKVGGSVAHHRHHHHRHHRHHHRQTPSRYRSSFGSEGLRESSFTSESFNTVIRFNDSFCIPVMVVDSEGLHSFTLSLEMFAKELRRVLYGLEEMLQKQ